MEAFEWQASRLTALEPALAKHLAEAPQAWPLLPQLASSEQREALLALGELRADAAAAFCCRLLSHPRYPISTSPWRF